MKITKRSRLFAILLIAVTMTVIVLKLKRGSFSLSSIAHASTSSPQKKENGIEVEEYAVYAALIKENFGENNAGGLLVINETPSPWISSVEAQPNFYEEMKKDSPALLAETVDDLRAKNKEDFKFTKNFNINSPYVLISDEEVQSFFKEDINDGWKRFYQKYLKSRGIMTLSRVGFNRDKTQALVYRANSCGGLCGGGDYYLLSKKNGVWVVNGTVGPSWVS